MNLEINGSVPTAETMTGVSQADSVRLAGSFCGLSYRKPDVEQFCPGNDPATGSTAGGECSWS